MMHLLQIASLLMAACMAIQCADVNGEVRQLAYVSSSKFEYTDDMLRDIAIACEERNRSLGVTGLLLYRDGNVWQILEGKSDVIEDLFVKIKQDDRHHGINVILNRIVQTRDFPYWNFAFKNLSFTQTLTTTINDEARAHCTTAEIKLFDELLQDTNDKHHDAEKVSHKVQILIHTFQRVILRYEPLQRCCTPSNIWARPTLSRANSGLR